MKHIVLMITLGALLAAPVALAGERAGGKEDDSAAKIAALIERLGSELWAEREEASVALEKIGRPALPALRKALRSKDAEVASRVKDLIEKLDPPKKTAARPGGPAVIRFVAVGGPAGIFVIEAQPGGANVKRVVESGKNIDRGDETVRIAEGDGGVTVTVKPKKKGAEARTYTAKNRAEFKKKHKAAYMKYLATPAERKKAAAEAKKSAAKKADAAK